MAQLSLGRVYATTTLASICRLEIVVMEQRSRPLYKTENTLRLGTIMERYLSKSQILTFRRLSALSLSV